MEQYEEALKRGDQEAWHVLTTQMQEPLRRFISRQLAGHANSAQEVTELEQRTWVQAQGSIGTDEGGSKVDTWVFGVARHVVQDFFKQVSQIQQLQA
jgi:DNA-directed RNA polymerase specialized sigma24 family protein